METIDKNYLRLQFWNKVYQKNATEFQSFFEDIMQKAFSDFQKIRPYGKQGDRGNDGYSQMPEYIIKYILPQSREKRKQMLQKSSKKISKN